MSHHCQVSGDATIKTEEQRHISDEDLERIEIREVLLEVEEVKKEYAKFNALIPVCDFAASDAGHATTLAKEISSDLELLGQPQTFDLFTKDNVKGTFNVSDLDNDFNNQQRMFFIKENLYPLQIDWQFQKSTNAFPLICQYITAFFKFWKL